MFMNMTKAGTSQYYMRRRYTGSTNRQVLHVGNFTGFVVCSVLGRVLNMTAANSGVLWLELMFTCCICNGISHFK